MAVAFAVYLKKYHFFARGEAIVIGFVTYYIFKSGVLIEEMYKYRSLDKFKETKK